MTDALAKTCPHCDGALTLRLGELECRSCGHVIPPGAPDTAHAGSAASSLGGASETHQGARGYQTLGGVASGSSGSRDHEKSVFFSVFVMILFFSTVSGGIACPYAARLDMINGVTPTHPLATGLMMVFGIIFYAILAAITYWALYCQALWVKWGCLVLTLTVLVLTIGNVTNSLFTWILIDAPGQSFPGVVRLMLALSVLGQFGIQLWFLKLLYHDTKRQP